MSKDHPENLKHMVSFGQKQGDWGANIPFYQALNALAHVDLSAVDNQLGRAFERLVKKQHPDGTWGDSEKEWNGFLALHALRRKGIL